MSAGARHGSRLRARLNHLALGQGLLPVTLSACQELWSALAGAQLPGAGGHPRGIGASDAHAMASVTLLPLRRSGDFIQHFGSTFLLAPRM